MNIAAICWYWVQNKQLNTETYLNQLSEGPVIVMCQGLLKWVQKFTVLRLHL